MATVYDRESLKQYCLRKLGAPVIQINVDDAQIDDRIDDAISMFQQYHADAIIKQFKATQLTQEDIDNQKIPVPENTLSVVKVFPIQAYASSNMNISYVAAMSDILDSIRNSSAIQGTFRYFVVEQHLSMLQQFFARENAVIFNRYMGYIHLDFDWSRVKPGDYIIVECWVPVDMDQYDAIWNDWWLKQYTTALIKLQWGMNMIKYEGIQLPSGIQLNGRQIYDDAVAEIAALEQTLQETWQLPIDFFMG